MSARMYQAYGEPDGTGCRTVRGQNDIYQCVGNAISCNYGISMGYAGTFCIHPMRREWQQAHSAQEPEKDASWTRDGEGDSAFPWRP